MVVGDLEVESIPLVPAEADAVLIVDPDAVLPFAASFERFQPVSGKQGQVAERGCPIQVEELAASRIDKQQISKSSIAYILKIMRLASPATRGSAWPRFARKRKPIPLLGGPLCLRGLAASTILRCLSPACRCCNAIVDPHAPRYSRMSGFSAIYSTRLRRGVFRDMQESTIGRETFAPPAFDPALVGL